MTPQSSYGECQSAFASLINRPSRKVRIEANLEYDILSNSNKYIKNGNFIKSKKISYLLYYSRTFR